MSTASSIVSSLLATTAKNITVAPYVAPYMDITLSPQWSPTGFQPQNLSAIASAAGLKAMTAAFIVAQGGTDCLPAWGGYSDYSVAAGFGVPVIKEMLASGRTVYISFGGASGVPLQSTCRDVHSLQAAIASTISAYGSKQLDFDIEGASVTDSAANQRLAEALRQLQTVDPAITVSLTLPVLTTGLTPDGINVVKCFQQANVKFKVNIMTMDYGASGIDMGKAAIQAANATYQQLQSIFPAESSIGDSLILTPMIGVNDVPGEYFTLPDAVALREFAQSSQLEIRYWDINRDHPCDGVWPSLTCSGSANGTRMQTTDYQFARTFSKINAGLLCLLLGHLVQGCPQEARAFHDSNDWGLGVKIIVGSLAAIAVLSLLIYGGIKVCQQLPSRVSFFKPSTTYGAVPADIEAATTGQELVTSVP